jgi:putative transcriptional regulator
VNALETGRYDPALPLAFRIARLFARPIESIFIAPVDTDADTDADIAG